MDDIGATDLGDDQEDFSIFIYGPSAPNVIRTLKPNVAGAHYYFVESPQDRWREYFVDTNKRSAKALTLRGLRRSQVHAAWTR